MVFRRRADRAGRHQRDLPAGAGWPCSTYMKTAPILRSVVFAFTGILTAVFSLRKTTFNHANKTRLCVHTEAQYFQDQPFFQHQVSSLGIILGKIPNDITSRCTVLDRAKHQYTVIVGNG